MDMSWLASEAKQLHSVFASLFYSILLTMLLFGVVTSYFKMPLGQVPEFLNLVGRAIVASFLLVALPEIMNTIADITDAVSRDIGQLNNFKLVLGRLGEKIESLTWSWVSVKDSVLLIFSYVVPSHVVGPLSFHLLGPPDERRLICRFNRCQFLRS